MQERNPPVDATGVEVLTAEAVEDRARATLRAFDPALVTTPHRVPIEEMVVQLADSRVLTYDGGAVFEGLLGRCWLRGPARIEISLEVTGARRRFVIAHELGHFTLHRHLQVLARDYVVDDEQTIFGKHALRDKPSARHWMEWQANRFAASLLMPVDTLPAVLSEAIARTRRLRGEARTVALGRYVAERYDVGQTAARIRVQEVTRLAAQWSAAALNSVSD